MYQNRLAPLSTSRRRKCLSHRLQPRQLRRSRNIWFLDISRRVQARDLTVRAVTRNVLITVARPVPQ